MTILRCVFALLAAVTWSGAAFAQQTEAAFKTTTLNVSGQGETRIKPDIVLLWLGVAAEAATAKEASSESGGKIADIIQVLRRAGVAQSDIQTQSVELEPKYSDRSNAPRVIVAHSATTMLLVKVRDMDRAGALLDLAVGAGANRISGVRYAMADPSGAQRQARDQALRALQENAQQMAEVMGYRVVRLINANAYVNEGVVTAQYRIAEPKPGTQVLPGELTVRASASGTYELTPR